MTNECYLDNAATTRPFDAVVDTHCGVMRTHYHNPAALYAPALAAQDLLDAARARVAAAVGLRDGRVCLTAGGTEADNLAILGAVGARAGNIVLSALEHPAVLRAAQALGERVQVRICPVRGGVVHSDDLAALVDADTLLVSVMHVCNETGARNDIAALSKVVKAANARTLFHSDGVQAFLREPVAMHACEVDLYSVSAHKVHGPRGVGALCIKKNIHLQPYMHGGGQEYGLRSGTQNVPGIAAFGAAIAQWSSQGDAYRANIQKIGRSLRAALTALEGARINSPTDAHWAAHILSVSFPGLRGEVLLHALAEHAVLVGTGSACSARAGKPNSTLLALGLDAQTVRGTIRISVGAHNTPGDAQRLLQALQAVLPGLYALIRKRK